MDGIDLDEFAEPKEDDRPLSAEEYRMLARAINAKYTVSDLLVKDWGFDFTNLDPKMKTSMLRQIRDQLTGDRDAKKIMLKKILKSHQELGNEDGNRRVEIQSLWTTPKPLSDNLKTKPQNIVVKMTLRIDGEECFPEHLM